MTDTRIKELERQNAEMSLELDQLRAENKEVKGHIIDLLVQIKKGLRQVSGFPPPPSTTEPLKGLNLRHHDMVMIGFVSAVMAFRVTFSYLLDEEEQDVDDMGVVRVVTKEAGAGGSHEPKRKNTEDQTAHKDGTKPPTKPVTH